MSICRCSSVPGQRPPSVVRRNVAIQIDGPCEEVEAEFDELRPAFNRFLQFHHDHFVPGTSDDDTNSIDAR